MHSLFSFLLDIVYVVVVGVRNGATQLKRGRADTDNHKIVMVLGKQPVPQKIFSSPTTRFLTERHNPSLCCIFIQQAYMKNAVWTTFIMFHFVI